MKIRNGFVSNSSSSSFVVNIEPEDKFWNDKLRVDLTSKQLEILLQAGFQFTDAWMANDPMKIELSSYSIEGKDELSRVDPAQAKYAFYSVICNEDEIIEVLLKHKISFSATVHYGHYHYIYDAKTDELTVAKNYGMISSMYGIRNTLETEAQMKEYTDHVESPIVTYRGKEYLKKRNPTKIPEKSL